MLKKNKFNVSIIYGALSPEVRKKQAQMFSNGQNQVLVSTDAIGMGMNLPIKRVIFSTLEKYDGQSNRSLIDSEIQQIAGRAGRFGLYDEGFVALLQDDDSINEVKDALTNQSQDHAVLQVAPHDWHITQISKIIESKKIDVILNYFSAITDTYENIFVHANLKHMCDLYEKIKSSIKSFSLVEQYKLLTAPVNAHEEDSVSYYLELIQSIKNKENITFGHYAIYGLLNAEQVSKNITTFVWLSNHYPDIIDNTGIELIREKVSSYIIEELSRINGYTLWQPRYREDDEYMYDDYENHKYFQRF